MVRVTHWSTTDYLVLLFKSVSHYKLQNQLNTLPANIRLKSNLEFPHGVVNSWLGLIFSRLCEFIVKNLWVLLKERLELRKIFWMWTKPRKKLNVITSIKIKTQYTKAFLNPNNSLFNLKWQHKHLLRIVYQISSNKRRFRFLKDRRTVSGSQNKFE